MSYKSLTKKFILTDVIIVFVIFVAMMVYDPLHIFHKSWITKGDRFHGDMRMQAAGVINNYEFDSIILGSSMMKGTSATMASAKLGGEFVNLSANGASIFERKYIAGYALQKKNIQKIIISFDTGMDQNLIKSNRKFPLTKFKFLYDDIFLNDVKVYWNYKFVGCLVSFSTSTACIGSKRELQKKSNWFSNVYKRNQKISGIKNWVHNKDGRGEREHLRIQLHLKQPIDSVKKYEEKLFLTKEIIDISLLSLIKKHRGVKFYVVFPPYSRFLYSLWKKKNPLKYLLYKETLRYLVIEGSKYENLKIYSFDDLKYLDDLDNYRDMRHYNTEINLIMLDAIKEGTNIINAENLEIFLGGFDKLNHNYKLSNELNYILKSYL